MSTTKDFNIDQSLCAKNNAGGETATCIFESLSTGEDATLSQEQIYSTTYQLVCGCLLFTGDSEDEEATDSDDAV